MKKSHSVVKLKKCQNKGSTVIASQRIIFDGPKFLSSSKRKGIRKLEQFWDKKTVEKALFLINSVSNIKHFVTRRKSALTKAVRILYTSSLKHAFCSWRDTIFQKHRSLTLYTHKEHHRHTQTTYCHINSLQNSLSSISQHSRAHLVLSRTFFCLRSFFLRSKFQKSVLKPLLKAKYRRTLLYVFRVLHKNCTQEADLALEQQELSHNSQTSPSSLNPKSDRTKNLTKILTKIAQKQNNKEKAKAVRLLESFGVSRMASEYLQKSRAARSVMQWAE